MKTTLFPSVSSSARPAAHSSASQRRARRAFTLIELLTVIAIIGILAAIIIPTVGRVRGSARKAACVSNMRQWGNALRMFANDNKGMVALYLDVGSPTVENGVTYTRRLYESYFGSKTMLDNTGTKAVSSQEAMCRCPEMMSLEGEGDFLKRCYAFTRPFDTTTGKRQTKKVAGTTFGLAPSVGTIDAYDLATISSPASFVAMWEMSPPEAGRKTLDKPADLSLAYAVRPQQLGTGGVKIRHGGIANVLFADSHVESLSPAHTDYDGGDAATKTRIEGWFRLN